VAAGRQIFSADFSQPKTESAFFDSALAAAYKVDAELPNAASPVLLVVAHTHQREKLT